MSKYTDPHDLAWRLANRTTDVLQRADNMRDALATLITFLEEDRYDDATKAWVRGFVKPEIEKYDTVRAKGVRE